jgi:tetratricopeptide (TPR) repeat protein
MDFLLPDEEARLQRGSLAPAVEPLAGSSFLLPGEQTASERAAPVLRRAIPIKPDTAAENRRLSNVTGIPAPVVERNLDTVKTEARLREIQDAMRSSPILARQMTDPAFAALAHDDVENLVAIGDTLKPSKGPEASVSSVLTGLMKTLPQVFEGTRQGLRQQFGDMLGLTTVSEDAARKGARVAHETALSTPSFKGDPGSMGLWVKESVYGGLTSVVQNAPGLAASLLTMNPLPALATMGVQSEAAAYTKYRNRGASPVLAGLGALGEGATEVATEMLPMGFMLKKLGKVGAGEFLKGFLLAREIPGEQIATLVQDAIDTAVANPDKTWAQYAAERPEAAFRTLVATVTQAGVMAGTGAAMKKLANVKPDAANADAEVMEKLLKLGEASQVRARDPSSFEAYVTAANEDGPVQNIHVSAATFAQAAGENLAAIVQAMPSVGAQMTEALAMNGELVIPLGEFAANIPGTGLEQSLIDHIRTAPDAMTREEAKTFMQSGVDEAKAHAEKVMADHTVDDAFKQSAAKVEATLLGELSAANRFTDDVNKPYAQLASSFYQVQAARLGVSPEEMYARYPLKVQASSVAGSRVMDQQGGFFASQQTGDGAVYLKGFSPTQGQPVVTKDRSAAKRFKSQAAFDAYVLKNKAPAGNWADFSLAPHTETHTLGQPAYHGSPHVFDRFSISKIGAGEGNQSYGWGLYFAENPAVAEGYQRALGGLLPSGKVKGALYRVEIPDTAVAKMLDWDKPLGEQAPGVKAALGLDKPTKDREAAWDNINVFPPYGENGRRDYSADPLAITGRALYKLLSPNEKDATYLLQQKGIPGIKYLDGASRKHGEGTHNLVVFDDTLVTITHKDGTPLTPAERAEYDQQARGQISFTDTASVITLLQNADLSTFVHELGHFQLEVLADIAGKPDAPAEIVADMNALLKWFGVKDLAAWNAMSLEEKRPYHEQLARGFEAYLFEGNAPSQALHGIFSRMRAWMINVYKSLQALNVTLTDEVRGVFDRLIATNEQITGMEAERGYAPLFKSAEEMGATPAEWKAYQEQNVDQTQEAIDELQTRSLRNMKWLANARSKVIADLQKQAAAKRAAVEAEVKDEVRAQPIYAVQHFLKRGEMVTAEGEQIKVDKGHKLDNAALAEMYPETSLARPDLAGLQGMTRDEGLHPDLVAQMFGFTSGDHLVREILEAQSEAVVIEGTTDQRMLERYGDLTDQQSIERAADAAIHNEVRAKFIASELRALAKATGQRNVLTKAAKAFAEAIIARKLVRDVKPAQYSAAEARAGRAAEKAKSLVEKATEKRNQLVNHYAARAAYDALEDVQKAVDYLRRLDGAAARKSISPDYMEQIDQMLERFDLRSGQSLKAIDKRTALADWIKAQEALGFEPTIDDALRNEAFRKSFKDMTVEEVRGLVDAIKNIEHLGRLKNKLLTAKDQREFDAVVGDITASINATAKTTLPEQRASDRGALVKVRSLFRSAIAIHRKFASMVRQFDGYKDGGTAWEYLVRNMNERGDFEAVENEKATIALMGLLGPVTKAGKLTQKQYFPDSGKSFSREERIGIALNMGNEVNRERVMSGEALTPAQLETVLNTLTKADWTFVQGVWDYLDSFRPQIAAKERRVTGVEPEWVEAAPVQTKHGEFKGGYYPIAYDPLLSERSSADAAAEVQRQIQQGLYTRAQTRRGHTKARSESTGRTLRYDFGEVIARHVSQVVHDLAWHEYLIDANRLLRAGAIEHAVRDHYGVETLTELKDTLRDIAVGGMAAGKGSWFFDRVRHGTMIAGLGFNVFNAVQNLTGITQSMSRIGSKWVLKGAVHWAGDAVRFEGAINEIHAKSDFMRLRAKTFLREINEMSNTISGKNSKLKATYFWLQRKAQTVVDVPTWWGAYEKAMSQDKMDEAKAVALADQAVLDAQGGGQIKDLSGIQRTKGLELLTVFYGFFNTTFNNTAEAYGRTNFKKPGEVTLFAADMVLLYSLPALLSTLLKAALSGDWDDEEKLAKKIAGDQISYLLGTVVGVREMTAGVQAATGTGEGFGYSGPAATRLYVDLFKLGQQAHQGEVDEAFLKSLNSVGGTLLHYPSGQINRTLSGINALSDGKTENPGALLMGYRKP